MAKLSQKALFEQMKQASDPAMQRDRALDLLAATRSREYVDAALRVLLRDPVRARLTGEQRPVLREKVLYYFENDDKDRGGLIREQITRLLLTINHPGDLDLYMRGALTYHRQPVADTAQNLRAAALVGILGVDQALAGAYATRLLGEPDTSPLNGEPSLTALKVLAGSGQLLPVYLFVLRQGEAFVERGNGEVVASALEALADDALPRRLFAALAEQVAAWDVPVTSGGLAEAITALQIADLYPLLEHMLTTTRHADLVRYMVLVMAAARDQALIDLLYRLARTCPPAQVADYRDAVELTPGDDRDAIIALLERRL